MTQWSDEELGSIDRAYEIRVVGRRKDGPLRSLTPVRHGPPTHRITNATSKEATLRLEPR